MVKESKHKIRQRILSLVRSQKEGDRLKKSRVIQKKLFRAEEFKRAKTILFYASFDKEVETFRMMTQAKRLGKRIVLPTIKKDRRTMVLSFVNNLKKELIRGPYGIKEPKASFLRPVGLKEIDLAVVPGVAFDESNNRLGRGAGYYDRLLRRFPSTTPVFGLAFDFQILPGLPHHKTRDIPVSCVISN